MVIKYQKRISGPMLDRMDYDKLSSYRRGRITAS